MIRTIADIAAHLGAYDNSERAIARQVYKYTTCGCPAGVEVTEEGETVFWVVGYCEGVDVELNPHRVSLPCTPESIDGAVDRAEKEGEEVWNATHGCEMCHTADMSVVQTEKGWMIGWRDSAALPWMEDNEVQYRAEEWEIRSDFSAKLNEWNTDSYGHVPINPDCRFCKGQGTII